MNRRPKGSLVHKGRHIMFSTSFLPVFHMHGRFVLGRFVLLFVKVAPNGKLVENWRPRQGENW